MAVSDSAKVDLLYKKLFGVAKTDLPANKSPSNEAIASPSLLRGDNVWQQAASIPGTAATTAGIVQAYTGASAVQCTADTTSTPISSVYPSWKTNLADWIPSEFGSTYFVQVWVDSSGVANPTSTGTQIFDSGIAGVGEWNFDYQSGVLNFIGGTIPSSLTSSKVIYIVGYRYIGTKGIANFTSGLTIGNITISGNTITGNTGVTFGGNITGNVNGNVSGNLTGTVLTSTQSYITTVGNLGNLSVVGNITTSGNVLTSGLFYPNGAAYVFGSTYSNSNVSTFLSSFGSNSITTTGNITGNIITDYITGTTSNVVTVTGTGSLKLPVGSTANRPVGQIGYIRYNTDSATFEYFDGTAWISIVNGITDQQIDPDGASASYTLSQSSTDIGVLVSINGVVQKPTVAYTVSGTTITFSQVPEVTDLIDVRFLATSVVHEFDNINPGTYLNRVTATRSPTLIDSIPITGNTALQWIVTAVDNVNTNYTALTISSINTGSQVYYTGYGVLQSNTQANVATFTSNISSGNINLWATGDSANVTVTFERLALGSATRVGYLTAGPAGTISDVLVSGVKTFALDTNGNVTLPSGGMINYANGVSILTGITSGGSTYSNANVVANLQNYVTSISTTANITSTANLIAPNFLFANGVNILSTVAASSTYSNTNVSAYLTSQNITSANIGSYQTWANANVAGLRTSITSLATNANTNTAAYLAAGISTNVTTTGNISAGNVSVGGNLAVTGTLSGSGSGLTGVALKTTGSWTVTTGTNTYSITVPASGTYQIWVRGNIPNGIIAYIATAVVTNTNVPVVGAQYAWVYNGGGSPIDFTSIPNQFTGTGNTIVRSSVAPSPTTNVFDFGISNTSGSSQTVYWGYIALG